MIESISKEDYEKLKKLSDNLSRIEYEKLKNLWDLRSLLKFEIEDYENTDVVLATSHCPDHLLNKLNIKVL